MKTDEMGAVIRLLYLKKLLNMAIDQIGQSVATEEARQEPFIDAYMDMKDVQIKLKEIQQDLDKTIEDITR
jgi:hypothetical protein